MLLLNSISRACIQQAVHAGSLYVYTTISVAHTHLAHRNKGYIEQTRDLCMGRKTEAKA